MSERSKLKSLRDVNVTRISDTLSYGFPQTATAEQEDISEAEEVDNETLEEEVDNEALEEEADNQTMEGPSVEQEDTARTRL